MNKNLKPCPICGKRNMRIKMEYHHRMFIWEAIIKCPHCKLDYTLFGVSPGARQRLVDKSPYCNLECIKFGDTPEELQEILEEKWNTRVAIGEFTDTDSDEIRPCPFCGSNAVGYVTSKADIIHTWRYKISCTNCKAFMEHTGGLWRPLPESSRITWNKRDGETVKEREPAPPLKFKNGKTAIYSNDYQEFVEMVCKHFDLTEKELFGRGCPLSVTIRGFSGEKTTIFEVGGEVEGFDKKYKNFAKEYYATFEEEEGVPPPKLTYRYVREH